MLEVLLFGADNCGSCSLNETRIKDVLREFPEVKFTHYSLENVGELVKKYQILTAPTVLIMDDNQEIYRFTGIVERDRFRREIEYLKYKSEGLI